MNEAKALIEKSKLRILPKDDLDEAAMLSVHLAQIVHLAKEAHLNVNSLVFKLKLKYLSTFHSRSHSSCQKTHHIKLSP